MRSYSSMLAAALALASSTNAHMKMSMPAPYTANGALENGPLAADGSDFPCKMTSGQYTPPATKNTMAIGAMQTLKLLGSATHGGGSCQISLTKDLKPTKNSKWMVIHSEEGGCPFESEGNKGDKADAALDSFQYKIPQGISPGEYTFSWTWFNKIGNREMYQNCAPLTVTGGSGKRDISDTTQDNTTMTEDLDSHNMLKRDAAFPEMFVANIGNGCATDEKKASLKFPNPGPNTHKGGSELTPPVGNCKAAAAGPADSGSSGASPSSGASGSAPTGSAGNSGMPTVTGEGSDMGSGSSSPSGAASPSMSVVAIPPPGAPGAAKSSAAPSMMPMATGSAMGTPKPAVPAATDTASSSGSASSDSTGNSAAAGSMPCTTAGQSVCSADGMKIGTCNANKMAVLMPVAAGTKCSNGMMVHAKRSAKFAHGYGRHGRHY
ncbi:MAG: hypothetical protein LQ337_007821 [Flavoplaca oasis]|nr:MAG: hypothetical protein LQ337_007821 [Flavoplaca oasis]